MIRRTSAATAKRWYRCRGAQYPVPWFDNTITRRDLEYEPRRLPDAMRVAIGWLRENGQIP